MTGILTSVLSSFDAPVLKGGIRLDGHDEAIRLTKGDQAPSQERSPWLRSR